MGGNGEIRSYRVFLSDADGSVAAVAEVQQLMASLQVKLAAHRFAGHPALGTEHKAFIH